MTSLINYTTDKLVESLLSLMCDAQHKRRALTTQTMSFHSKNWKWRSLPELGSPIVKKLQHNSKKKHDFISRSPRTPEHNCDVSGVKVVLIVCCQPLCRDHKE